MKVRVKFIGGINLFVTDVNVTFDAFTDYADKFLEQYKIDEDQFYRMDQGFIIEMLEEDFLAIVKKVLTNTR